MMHEIYRELFNRLCAVCAIYLGVGSLDLANSMVDPVAATSLNERKSRDRVADAIARIAAHEIGHSLGLVATSTELNNDGLAAKLMVRQLMNGSSTHRNPQQSSGVNTMYVNNDLTLERAWTLSLYDFASGERTYLARILP